jgi:hypothetical protein
MVKVSDGCHNMSKKIWQIVILVLTSLTFFLCESIFAIRLRMGHGIFDHGAVEERKQVVDGDSIFFLL